MKKEESYQAESDKRWDKHLKTEYESDHQDRKKLPNYNIFNFHRWE